VNRFIYVLGLCAGLLATAVSNAQAAEKQCMPIGGEALGQFFNDGKDVVAAMSGTWTAARGTVKSQKKTATGLLLEMEHVFSTSDGGVVRTHDVAELTEVPGKKDTYMLELAYTVVESFGRLKDYTGTFNSFGLLKTASGEALVRYSGEVCK
jgi:hypothetical protein